MRDVPRPDPWSMRHSRHPAHRPRAARVTLPRDVVGRQLAAEHGLVIESVRWDSKPLPTPGDTLAPIRRRPWAAQGFAASPADQATQNVPAGLIGRLPRVAYRPPWTRPAGARATARANPSSESLTAPNRAPGLAAWGDA